MREPHKFFRISLLVLFAHGGSLQHRLGCETHSPTDVVCSHCRWVEKCVYGELEQLCLETKGKMIAR